jgi:hypothetical protein
MAEASKRTRHDGCGYRGQTHPGNLQQPVIEAASEEFCHRTERETTDMITATDMQCRWLPARHEQQAIVQRGEIRRGDHQNAARPQYPPHLPHGWHQIFHGDQVAIPDH